MEDEKEAKDDDSNLFHFPADESVAE